MIETIIRNYTTESRKQILKYVNLNLAEKFEGYLWFFKLVSIKYMAEKKYLSLDFTSYESVLGAMESLVDLMPDVFRLTKVDRQLTHRDLGEQASVIGALDLLPGQYFQEIEIIGWIYQYYRSDRKEQVLREIKKNKKVDKEDIGAVTQLFTPKWIVKYLVENSVGKLYLEKRPNQDLQASLDYYVDIDPQPSRGLDIRRLKILDPAMGTGHILVYVFDLLYKIYCLESYPQEDIALTILKNNIYGFDLDIYAETLSKFSLYMKAREVDPNIFKKNIQFNLYSFRESKDVKYDKSQVNKRAGEDLDYILDIFQDAKNLGSIIRVEKDLDFPNLYRQKLDADLLVLVDQARLLVEKYQVLIANPPYMGKRNMNQDLATYVNENYPRSKHDLSTVFMELQDSLLEDGGIVAMISPHSWMFLSSFTRLRQAISKENTISSLLHLGARLFDQADVGTVVQVVAFIMEKRKLRAYQGSYYNLVDYKNSEEKEKAFLQGKNLYRVDLDIYSRLAQHPYAYWLGERTLDIFSSNEKIGDLYTVKQGMSTSNNKRFLRFWYEVDREKIGFRMKDAGQAQASGKKWFPYNKGGKFRKWYGNNDIVINYENNGEEIIEYTSKLAQGSWVRIKSRDFYFKESISWPYITNISNFGPRLIEEGFIFDVAGPSLFIQGEEKYYIMGLLSSSISREAIRGLNPTMNFQIENIKMIPVIKNQEAMAEVVGLVKENIGLAKHDYDLYERSWDFKEHGLLAYSQDLELAMEAYLEDMDRNFNKLRNNEERLNIIFEKIYNLEGEWDRKIQASDITISRLVEKKGQEDNPYVITRREVAEGFISYLVGCIFGRYKSQLRPLKDNILIFNPIDHPADIVRSIRQALASCLGQENFEKNYAYLMNIISQDDKTSDEKLRDYFLYKTGFYNEHNRTYQSRPIYFLFESGKKNGLKGLFYLQNYRPDLLGILANKYGGLLEANYQTAIDQNQELRDNQARLKELQTYREFLGGQTIEIDLDDGIRVNYEKFQGLDYRGKKKNILTRLKL